MTAELEAALQEAAVGSAGRRRGIMEGVINYLSQAILGTRHRVKTEHVIGGMGNMTIGLMGCGATKGHTGSERLTEQEGPVAVATAATTGLILLQLHRSPRGRLSHFAVAILSTGPFRVNQSSMKLC